jgi:hypothetical protein
MGQVWREPDVEATNFETIVTDMLDGQYSNPIGIFCFNAAEGWSRDVSDDVSREPRRLIDLERRDVPACLQDFLDRHDWPRQLILRLG